VTKEGKGGERIDHFKLNQRISGAKNLREVLSAVHDSHQDFRARDAALACHRLAKHVGKYGQTIKCDEDVATFQLAINAAVTKASGMDPQFVSNTLRAFGKLTEKAVVVDEAAVRAVSDEAARVAGWMAPQGLSHILVAFAKLSEKGVDVDAAAVRAVSAAAPRVAGEMMAQAISNIV
jgi:hypothetical protein